MDKRHESIGIKQILRYEWLEKTVNMLLAGLDEKTIRQELHEFLAMRKGNGSEEDRSSQTRAFVVSNLMKTWVSPVPELINFRDSALALIRQQPDVAIAVHWAMISAVYPFWFNVAKQTGRLLSLQEQITSAQIISRLKEQYGDRQTVSRYARFVISSFVAWGILKDLADKGCYEKSNPIIIIDQKQVVLLLESALHASPEGNGVLNLLLKNPAFFPFQIPVIPSDFINQQSCNIEVIRYGLDDELLKLTSIPPKINTEFGT